MADYLSKHAGLDIDDGVDKGLSAIQVSDVINSYESPLIDKPVAAAAVKALYDDHINTKSPKNNPIFTGTVVIPDGNVSNLAIKFTSKDNSGFYYEPISKSVILMNDGQIAMLFNDITSLIKVNGNDSISADSSKITMHKEVILPAVTDPTTLQPTSAVPKNKLKEIVSERGLYFNTASLQSIVGDSDSNGPCNGMKVLIYCKSGTDVHSCEVFISRITDTTADYVVYGELLTGVELFTLNATANLSDVTLTITPTGSSLLTASLLSKL